MKTSLRTPLEVIEQDRKNSNHSYFLNLPTALPYENWTYSRFLFMRVSSTHNSTESSLLVLKIGSTGYFGLKIGKNRNLGYFRALSSSFNLTKMPQIVEFLVFFRCNLSISHRWDVPSKILWIMKQLNYTVCTPKSINDWNQ